MNCDETNQKWARHYMAARTPWGRLRLKVHFEIQRFLWQWETREGHLLKRAFDISVSLTMLLLLSPLLLVIGLLVKLEDGGPIFFTQTRIGQFGREFKMYKIRSMCLNAEQRLQELLAQNRHGEGVTFKIKDDPRVTKIGRWLRRCSFDELPQIYNVLKGDMSLVGPRPPLPREVKLYSLADRRRLAARPGVTCFWQISGRSEISFSGQVKLDLDYIEHRNFWVDAKILALTLPAVISGRGAC